MPITGYILNPPVLQKCSLWTIQDFSALECLWLWRESFSKLCSVPCVFRAFSEATPPVPLEMPAYVHLSTVWHGACVPPWAACTGILLFDPHAHSDVPQTTGRNNGEVMISLEVVCELLGLPRTFPQIPLVELLRPLWELRFVVLGFGARFFFAPLRHFKGYFHGKSEPYCSSCQIVGQVFFSKVSKLWNVA